MTDMPSPEHGDEPTQRLARYGFVMHHRDADVAGAGIAAIGLIARQIISGKHAQPGFAPQFHRNLFVRTVSRDVEPEKKSARGTPVAIAPADDPVGEIEFLPIKTAVRFDMRLVFVSGDG